MLEFFNKLFNEYFQFFIIGIIGFVFLVFILILFFRIRSKRKKALEYKKNANEAVSSLTQDEINNISKNSANPEEIKQILHAENEKITKSKAESKKTSKPKKQSTSTSKKTNAVKEEEISSKENKEDKSAKPVKTTTKKASKQVENNAKTQPETKNTSSVEKPKKQYLGKWKIKEQDGMFFADLTASNGGLLLRTEYYTTLNGVKNGIDTIKKNIDSGNFKISNDKYGHFQFKLYSSLNRVICVSEDYSSKIKCESGIESVKRFAKTAVILIDESEN